MGFVPLSINWGGIESGIFSGIVEVDGLDFVWVFFFFDSVFDGGKCWAGQTTKNSSKNGLV